jgi:hypothetical protein
MLPVCPSKASRGLGFVDLMSYSLTVWWPAAARNRLSGEIHSRLTCESECCIVLEQIPERASQKLYHGKQEPQGNKVRGIETNRIVWS